MEHRREPVEAGRLPPQRLPATCCLAYFDSPANRASNRVLRMKSVRPSSHIRTALVVLLTLAAGCDLFPFPFPPLNSRPAGRDFGSAAPLELDDEGRAQFTREAGPGVIDVFDLGPMSPGDRIRVAADPAFGSFIDPRAALFDAAEDLFAVNDDVNLQGGQTNSLIDEVVHLATARMYLAITASFFSSQSGMYIADVQVFRNGTPPLPAPQKILLNFAGGNDVDIRNVGVFDIVPFDAARIDPAYAGMTDQIKAGIIARVRAAYTRFNVEVLTSDDGFPAEGNDYSTIYFGRASRVTFGISEQVDTWNDDCCDDGIVFTDNYDDPFAVKPTVEQIAVAIGNVAAHEGGHLLGLSHVADITDLMDTTGSASTLLVPLDFRRSVLDRTVFPFGRQDGPKTLYATVGAAPTP